MSGRNGRVHKARLLSVYAASTVDEMLGEIVVTSWTFLSNLKGKHVDNGLQGFVCASIAPEFAVRGQMHFGAVEAKKRLGLVEMDVERRH
jgi:hypothetical protein